MKILFINPYQYHRPSGDNTFSPSFKEMWHKIRRRATPIPLAFGVLAALTPKKYEIEIIDDMRDKIDFDKDYDLIGITSVTINACRTYEIADEFRKRGKKVVLGGWHPSALPNEAKQHADSVVIGEAEELWPQLLHDLENGNLKPFYRQKKPVNLNMSTYIKTDRKLCKGGFLSDRVLASRGCPYQCDYCAISHNSYGALFRTRPISDIIEEIQSIPQKFLLISDASLTINPSYTKQLFREMKNLNKRFFCQGNINILAKDDEFLKLAAEAGCISWCIGLDSISQEVIDSIGKKTNKVNEYVDGIKKIHDYGMSVEGAFIFGFDNDNPTVFDDTFDAIQAMELDTAQFNILTPFPGTPIYNRLEKEGRILTKDWSKYDTIFHVVFQPKLMLTEELLVGTQSLYKKFYLSFPTLRRVLNNIGLSIYTFLYVSWQNYLYHIWSTQFSFSYKQ